MNARSLLAAALAAILLVAPLAHAQSAPAAAASAAAADPGLADFIRLLDTDESGVRRFYDVRWSEVRHERLRRLYDDLDTRLKSLRFDSLSAQGRVDYILVRNYIENARAKLALQERWLAEMDAALPFRKVIQDLEWSRRRLEDLNPESAAGAIAAVPDLVKKAREAIEAGAKAESVETPPDSPRGQTLKLTPTVALRAAGAVDSIRRTLSDWSWYYEGYKPDFAWWLARPRADAEKALDDYARFLREDIAGIKGESTDPLIGDPIGEEALLADMRQEMLAYAPADLIRIADREFAWCEAEMKKASNAMGFGDDWKAALAKVKQAHMPPGEQDEFVRAVARESIDWLKARDLVTIPPLCEETWRIEMLSPEAQKSLPFAVYGGQHIGVSYPTQGMTHDDKLMSMRGNNRHFTRNVTPHELIPGHHLQGYMEARERPYRQLFSTPFLVEGWALHWEMLMYDADWAKGPEDRVGMLFWRMHRCARIIVSLRFHLGEMSPAQMVDFLVDRVGHERFGATSEVRRYIGGEYSPLYQCGYMIGGLQLRALSADLVGSGAMPARQFHDTVLSYGPIPIELIRAGMKELAIDPETRATWRFAD